MEQSGYRHQDEALLRELIERGHARLDPGDGVRAGVEAIYRNAYGFFALSRELREASGLPFGCGYVPYGLEHSGDPDSPDQVDYFAASARTRSEAERLPVPEARALHSSLMDVFDLLSSAVEELIADMASSVGGADCGRRIGGGLRRWSLLQVHRARDLAPGRLINTPHEDGHLLTLAHATGPGLELEDDCGSFVPVSPAGGSMMVMTGSAATLLTAGVVRPLRHRVVAHAYARPRLSLLFFADLDPDLCMPWRSGPVNDGVDIGAHVLGNSRRFGVEGFERE